MLVDSLPTPERIAFRLACGLLPHKPPSNVLVRHAEGARCEGCGDPISPGGVECELSFAVGPPLRLHGQCADTWRSLIAA